MYILIRVCVCVFADGVEIASWEVNPTPNSKMLSLLGLIFKSQKFRLISLRQQTSTLKVIL